MIDPRLARFAIGAICSAVLFGWPWHPRLSRYRSISYPDPGPDRQPTNPFTGNPAKPQPHGGRIIRDGQWDPGWNYIDMRTGYQPRPHSGIPNPPTTDP